MKMKNSLIISMLLLTTTLFSQTIGLNVTDSVVTSLNQGKIKNVYIVPTEAKSVGGGKYELKFNFYQNNSVDTINQPTSTKVLAVFKDNSQIITVAVVTLTPGVEQNTTKLLQALKVYLQDLYGWTITEKTL